MAKFNKLPKKKSSELQRLLREPMRLCRWTGFFPVDGLSGSTITKTRCSTNFPYIVFHVVSVFGQIITTVLSLISFFSNSYNLQTSSNFIFYSTGLITAILLLKLAKNWTKLIKKTMEIETIAAGIRRPHNLWTYKCIAYIVMCLAVVEHILSIMSKLYMAMSELDNSNINGKVCEKYFKTSMPFIFNIKTLPWEDIRILYSHLVALVKEVDSKFCYLVLLSFFTNLFFISLQLFNTLIALHLTYYIYSFVFLMTRASVMCLLAANVHKAAQEPLFVVRYVPASEYTLEVQRFIRQIRYTTTALSGVYFYVTRSTLLKVVGTLLTYELVLLQFNLDINGSIVKRTNIMWKEKV
nr:gustatory receptor 8 [Papilio dardanus]